MTDSEGIDVRNRTVLVVGATGMQGGAVARSLIRSGATTRALTRTPGSDAAQTLEQSGAVLIEGELDDIDSLSRACDGVDAIFSMQNASFASTAREVRHASNLVEAAQRSGVGQIVHTSVSAVGWRERHPDVPTRGSDAYWDGKEQAEEVIRSSGIPSWTILRPAYFMENFIPPKAHQMFPSMADGELVVATSKTTRLAVIAGGDLGELVTAATSDPRRLHGEVIELAGDFLTFPEIAQGVGQATGEAVPVSSVSLNEFVERYTVEPLALTQQWFDDVGYSARPGLLPELGLPETSFREWAEANRNGLRSALESA